MNKKLRHKLNLNQWKNTEDVIDKFKSINDKQHCKFVIFDIEEFYPLIKESLLKQSLDRAENTSTFPVKTKPSSNMQESLCFSRSKKKMD